MGQALPTRIASARTWRLEQPWLYLLAGLCLAPVFGLTPFLELVGWYFAALIHELGHTSAAWLVGVPAIPTLGITAEAATIHGEQQVPLALAVWIASAVLVWRVREPSLRSGLLALLMISYPVLAFGPLREVVLLSSGHIFELVIAGLFLERALSGGLTSSQAERLLYSVVGWFLVGRNAVLTLGLTLSPAARADYEESGSFGTTNDYVRLAEALECRLQLIAACMTLAALAAAPLAVAFWRWSSRRGPAAYRSSTRPARGLP